MARLSQNFRRDEMPDTGGFDPIPDGWYSGVITSAEVKQSGGGTGEYINLRIDVIGPTHQGRVLFARITTMNQSQKAEEIGRQQLGRLMHALNIDTLNDTDQLVNGRINVKVTIKAAREERDAITGVTKKYDAENEVKDYKAGDAGGSQSSMPHGQASSQQQETSGRGSSTPPWKKK